MPLQAQGALDRNIARGTDVGLSIALEGILKSLGDLHGEVARLQRRLTTRESAVSIRERAENESKGSAAA